MPCLDWKECITVLANAHHLIGFGEFLVPVKYTSKLQLPAESRCFTLPPLLHDEQPKFSCDQLAPRLQTSRGCVLFIVRPAAMQTPMSCIVEDFIYTLCSNQKFEHFEDNICMRLSELVTYSCRVMSMHFFVLPKRCPAHLPLWSFIALGLASSYSMYKRSEDLEPQWWNLFAGQ
jgi:hypothetical protein